MKPDFSFDEMIERLRTFTPRAEIILEEVPAPQKLATFSFAFTADVSNGLQADAEDEIASGRFVILHEPGGQDTWEGEFRCVTFMRADVESEMQEDPLLPEVGWNWLLDSLNQAGAHYNAPSGTVTRVSSASFGKLSPRTDESEIEIRASWTPLIDNADDMFAHVSAWCNLMTEVAGLPPIPEGVASISLTHVAVVEQTTPTPDSDSEVTATPLLAPAAGVPPVIDTEAAFDRAIQELRAGSGPYAFDAERASGYKYSARAYLIQIKRTGGGLHLIDPIAFGPGHRCFLALNDAIAGHEVILHASTQDLPCLREVGINPTILFDTELGGRIAGLPRVGLGPLLETLMGVSLAKEHSAVDWSTRPLPHDWLNYAALDVELLVELRDKVYHLLVDAKKWEWAQEEFQSILAAPPAPPRIDPWRRTSGMHKVKKRNHMAVIRELWNTRNELAQEADVSPGRLLSDAAITEIALASDKSPITNRKHLEKILRPLGLRSRWLENSASWISAITTAVSMPEDQWPESRSKSDAMPPVKIWRERFPERYAPLSHARFNLQLRADELSIPLENMISPEVVRRICWQPPTGDLGQALVDMGVRRWQCEIATPILAAALLEREPIALPEPTEASAEE